jgi:hypothetical protein
MLSAHAFPDPSTHLHQSDSVKFKHDSRHLLVSNPLPYFPKYVMSIPDDVSSMYRSRIPEKLITNQVMSGMPDHVVLD